MYVEIVAVACAASVYLLAAVLWVAAGRVPEGTALRQAAIAEAVVGTGLLLRAWAPHSEYGPILVVATVAYGAHAVWLWTALRELRRQPWWPAWAGTALGSVALCAAAGLVWPGAAYAGLGAAYVTMALMYAACLGPALRGVNDEQRTPLRLLAAGCAACALMYLGWGGAMLVAPQAVLAQASGPVLAGSFLFGLWLNLLATSGWLLLVVRQLVGEIESIAMLDPLTGASNRRGLEHWLARRRPGAVPRRQGLIAIDIDHFKRINDSLGHAAGDAVLAACAARLRAQLRQDDHLSRVGGEEFLVVLDGRDPGATDSVAERLRAAVAATPVPLQGQGAVAVTVSLGVADGDAANADDLARADRALYAAKQAGRDRVVRAA
jgi:diguanylate cyclase (GGDEF)-like protein